MKNWFWIVALVVFLGFGIFSLLRESGPPSGPVVSRSKPVLSSNLPPPGQGQKRVAGAPSNAQAPAAVSPAKPPQTFTAEIAAKAPVLLTSASGITGQSATVPGDASSQNAETAIDNLRTTFRNYSSRFGGNPVGTNPEITKALNGGNPRQVKFLSEETSRINENGELVDPWGTPYFFHQLSGTEMEIRCAGPDRVMYTDDDLVTR